MVDGAPALGLLPALDERVVAGLERDSRRFGFQNRVQLARRGMDGPPTHVDAGQALAVEANKRVEEIEEDGGVRHGPGPHRGFRPAYPSPGPCQ